MTTIVCNRRGMTADKRATGCPQFLTTKIFRVNGSLIGFSGNIEHALRFIEWRRSPDTKPVFDGGFNAELLELHADGTMTYWGSEMVGIKVEDDHYAIGSGAHLAIGAMAMGATPEHAICIAAKWDNSTGFEIQTMKLKAKK